MGHVVEFDRLQAEFESFGATAFRLQGRRGYPQSPEDRDRYPEWRRTGIAPRDQEWLDIVAANTQAGMVMRRVVVVNNELTDWDRYCLVVQQHNVEAGERVRVLPMSGITGLPSWDFWLFDSHVLYNMHHSDLDPVRVERETDTLKVVAANIDRDKAWGRATPLGEFVHRTSGASS